MIISNEFKCNLCGNILHKNTASHLRRVHEFTVTYGHSERGKEVRKALEKKYFTVVRCEYGKETNYRLREVKKV